MCVCLWEASTLSFPSLVYICVWLAGAHSHSITSLFSAPFSSHNPLSSHPLYFLNLALSVPFLNVLNLNLCLLRVYFWGAVDTVGNKPETWKRHRGRDGKMWHRKRILVSLLIELIPTLFSRPIAATCLGVLLSWLTGTLAPAWEWRYVKGLSPLPVMLWNPFSRFLTQFYFVLQWNKTGAFVFMPNTIIKSL